MSVKMFVYIGPADPVPCQLAVSFWKPSLRSWKIRIESRRADIAGFGTSVM